MGGKPEEDEEVRFKSWIVNIGGWRKYTLKRCVAYLERWGIGKYTLEDGW